MPRILVVDDNAQIRRMLSQFLEHMGHDVTEASNGKEAMALHQAQPAELVITDLIMPEQEGIESIAQLRRQSPDVKIIAMSGGGRVGPADYLDMAKRLGAHRTFTKPFSLKEVYSAVEELLKESPAS